MRILIVEDSPTDRELLRYLLEEHFQTEAKFREADTLEAALKYLRTGNIDCVLLDLTLPDSAGKETFQKLHAQFPAVPMVIMTHRKDRQLALELIKLGAADYLIKDYSDSDAETVFSRIMFAVEKDRHSMRILPDDAASVKRLETARANLKTAHQSGEFKAVPQSTFETTTAIADLSQRMFAEVQKISVQLGTQGTQLNHMGEQVSVINKELFQGGPNTSSIKSQLAVMSETLRSHESDIRGLKRGQDDNRQSVVDLEKEQVVFQTKAEVTNTLTSTKMTNRTKVLLAILAAVTTLGAAIIGYQASNENHDKPQTVESMR